jgi:hypothetical protein
VYRCTMCTSRKQSPDLFQRQRSPRSSSAASADQAFINKAASPFDSPPTLHFFFVFDVVVDIVLGVKLVIPHHHSDIDNTPPFECLTSQRPLVILTGDALMQEQDCRHTRSSLSGLAPQQDSSLVATISSTTA